MIGGGTAFDGAAGLLTAAVGGLAVALAVLWRALRRDAADHETPSDGAVVLISDGIIQQASPDARVALGATPGRPVADVMARIFGTNSSRALEAVGRLERTGERFDMLLQTAGGMPVELIGTPSGAMLRLVVRDARYLDERLREAEARLRAAEADLREAERQRETLHGLVAEGPLIAWQRTAEGSVTWSAGQIRSRTGPVTADQTVELIVARTRLDRQPALVGQPQKSRIEIVVNDASETVSLHVVEIVRPDGSRIGFATDAGTAAAAERTLTRFVQTMTETFAHLTVGLAIFDRNQTLALFNPALVQMWQVEPAWLARRPSLRDILDELRAIRRLPELEDFHQWRTRILGLFENTEAADYEELWHLADGSNVRVLARPHPHGALAFTFDDVTERVRLEQRYRHSIELRRATLDGLNEGVAVFGANGLLQFVNQAFHEIWGTDGDTVYAAMHARQLIALCETVTADPELWQKLHGFITGEEGRRAWTARLRTGCGRALTARFAPLPDGSTVAVFADVTQAERIAEALGDSALALEMAEAVRRALAGLVVDTAMPALDRIGDAIGALGGAQGSPDGTGGALKQIAATAAGLERALGQAREIASRPFAAADRAQEGDPGDALRFVAAIVAPRAESAGARLVIDTAAAGTVACPAARLRQIAFGLAVDAIERCAPGGRVALGAEGSAARFSVGASAEPARPPNRAAEQRDTLALLHLVVERHGGRVEVDEDPSTGARRVTCHFGERRPDHGSGGPRTGPTDRDGRSFPGNVHALRSRAS